MAELRPIIVFHGSHFVRHLVICNPICVKLVQAMSGVISRNLKKTTSLPEPVFLASTNAAYSHTHRHTDTHTHTHTHTSVDSNKRNEMRCISPKNHSLHEQKLKALTCKAMNSTSSCKSYYIQMYRIKK